MARIPILATTNSAVVAIGRPELDLASAVAIIYRAWLQSNRNRRPQVDTSIAQDSNYAIMRGM